MNIDPAQFTKIVQTVFEQFEPTARERGAVLSASEAELIVAISQLAVAADRVADGDERSLLATLAGHVYAHAKLATEPPTYAPAEHDEDRLEHMRTHAAQLRGTPAGALAYALAYILTIADLELAPSEGEFIEELREALGLEVEQSDDLVATVTELITPPE